MTTARTPLSRIAYILALFLLLALPAVASAQTPWSTPDASNNINNTNTGNVGVGTGTSAPTGKLDVKGSTSDANAAALTVRSLSDTNLFFVRNDGRVGIGATSPRAFFHVAKGDASTGVAAFFQKDTSSSGITLGTTNSRGFISGVNSDLTGMTDLLVNPFGGSVGIGTTSPGSTLFVVTPAGTRSGVTIMGDGNSWVYTDLVMRPATTTSISAGMPYSFDWSVRKDNAYGGDASGPSLVMEIARQGGGVYAPFIINPNGNVILAGSLNATNGNVGVGTTTPSFKLDVSGQVRSSGGFVFPNGTVQTTAATLTGVTAGTGLIGGGSSGSVTLNVAAGTGITAAAGGVSVNYGSTAGTAVQGNTTLTVTAGTGMSGGGTTTLGSGGTVTLNNSDTGSSQNIFKNVGNAAGATQFSAGTNTDTLRFEGTGGTSVSFDTANKKVVINSTSASSSGWTDSGTSVSLTNATAKVGIGTTPGTKLQVNGTTLSGITAGTSGDYNARSLMLTTRPLNDGVASLGFDTNSTYRGAFDFNGGSGLFTWYNNNGGGWNPRLAINASGNIGIGTTTPAQKLQIGGNTPTSTSTPDAISLGATYSGTAGENAKLRLYDDNATGVYGLGSSDHQFDFMAPATARYVWYFNGVEKMRLDDAGNVTVAGNIAARYQDVAEWVPSTQKLASGTVVVLDADKTNHVLASTFSYDTKVAGVVSAEPGVILGVGGEGKLKVATTGRVKVKVDATRAPIKVGDLLVTSDVEGVAMRSEPVEVGGRKMHAPGTIIGKALEPLTSGTGEILVLLSLQ